jgi:hypothetical protein
MARTRNTSKTATKRATDSAEPKVVKKETVIQYIDFGYVATSAPPGVGPAVMYGSYGNDDEGSEKDADLDASRAYNVGNGVMLVQFSCGDYVYINIEKLEKVISTVKAFAPIQRPPSIYED